MSLAVSAHDVDDALARLHRQDPAAAAEAEQALHAFASADWDGEAAPPLEFDRLRVATWLWDTVPNTFVAPDEDKLHVVGAVALFLAELGPAGAPYAALCRHPATETLVTAAGDEDRIADLYREALASTGCEPPDVAGFAWSALMGYDEATAFDVAGRALCDAVDAGRLVPGSDEAGDVRRAVTLGAIGERIPTILADRRQGWLQRLGRFAPKLATRVGALLEDAPPLDADAATTATARLRAVLLARIDPTTPWARAIAEDPIALLDLSVDPIFPDDPLGEAVALAVCVAAFDGRAATAEIDQTVAELVGRDGVDAPARVALSRLQLLRVVPAPGTSSGPPAADVESRAIVAYAIRRRSERPVNDPEWL